MKLRIQAGALTPVANIMVPPIVSADFSLGFWGTEDHWRRVSLQGIPCGFAWAPPANPIHWYKSGICENGDNDSCAWGVRVSDIQLFWPE